MADIGHLLAAMHPMREPPSPEAVAPSLVLLIVGCVTAVAIILLMRWLQGRRNALKRSAQAILADSRRLDRDARLAAQASLLRRLVRALVGENAARQGGAAWLAMLDRTFATRFFTEGPGVVFGDPLYRRPGELDIEGLDCALGELIGKVRA